MDKKTIYQHQEHKLVFCSVNSMSDLAHLLRTEQRRLQLMAAKPGYKSFPVPKKGGGERQIEAPNEDLKKTLSFLNHYLQSTYVLEKSVAAFGFVTGVRNDEDRRNVLTNANKHLGNPWMLNLDLEDFFHQVSRDKVAQIFAGPPFHFKRDIPDFLADLCTYQGRLPMGAPTSPVLSNFACREMDMNLYLACKDKNFVYTRYADDMTFSGPQALNEESVAGLSKIIEDSGFRINARKSKIFGPDDPKVVTGLLLQEKEATLSPEYLDLLGQEIQSLHNIMWSQNEQGQISTRWIEQMKQQVRGRLNFAGFVLKRNDARYNQLKDAFYTACNPPQEEFGAVNWRSFPYNF
jgi:RNA-directed DNA polymerase